MAYSILKSIEGMSRKQRLCWFIVLTATALVCFDKLTGTEWVGAVTLALGAFSAANVFDKAYGGGG